MLGGVAIGSPTLEMFIASWNEVYPTELLVISGEDDYGFSLGDGRSVVISGMTGWTNPLYSKMVYWGSTSIEGYLLSSPISLANKPGGVYWGERGAFASAGEVGAHNFTNDGELGVRPVVCIPSSLLVYNSDTSSWDINV